MLETCKIYALGLDVKTMHGLKEKIYPESDKKDQLTYALFEISQ